MVKKLLTQEQVDQLPDGTAVTIMWSGGNGPHLYYTKRKNRAVYAVSPYNERTLTIIDFVGHHPLTQVELKI